MSKPRSCLGHHDRATNVTMKAACACRRRRLPSHLHHPLAPISKTESPRGEASRRIARDQPQRQRGVGPCRASQHTRDHPFLDLHL